MSQTLRIESCADSRPSGENDAGAGSGGAPGDMRARQLRSACE